MDGLSFAMQRTNLTLLRVLACSLATSSQMPVLVAWGTSDKYLNAQQAESWCQVCVHAESFFLGKCDGMHVIITACVIPSRKAGLFRV
jgi:hypothetical protein